MHPEKDRLQRLQLPGFGCLYPYLYRGGGEGSGLRSAPPLPLALRWGPTLRGPVPSYALFGFDGCLLL